ncbi:allantoicase [Tropicimonas sp. IMCC34043]|uniref:allantoicase n=1 Tax=Tropicimonas sp. IMCC34043 TaxID=2248760 RepID=UPI000E2772D4|nr:allantoicase [Tropicimonas sp. IMCC34043]
MTDTPDQDIPQFARSGINLASGGLGARGLYATDEFFAPLERMLADTDPVFIADKYDDNGKWMDGWETRRRRGEGHDHAVITLAAPGRITGFDVDTRHFTGNYAPAVRIEAAWTEDLTDATEWVEVLPLKPLGPNAHHFFSCRSPEVWHHLRLHIYPDGGVARLRVFGMPELRPELKGANIDLAAALNGGRVLAVSDAHYGDPQRLLFPGRGANMGDGWETRRRRAPGHDWAIIALGARGTIDSLTVDTAHFKGNFPDRCSFQVADLPQYGDALTDALVTQSMFWKPLLAEQPLSADHIHEFRDEVEKHGPVTHVRFNIQPDGGVSRVRINGLVA